MTVTINGTSGVSLCDTNSVPTAALQASAVTQPKVGSGVAGNGPAFSAYASSGTSCSNNASTVIAYATKILDTGTCYNNTGSTATLNGISVPAYSFAPNVAGWYQITGAANSNNAPGNSNVIMVFKNASGYSYGSCVPATGSVGFWCVSSLVFLNGTSDYVSIRVFQNSGSTITTNNDTANVFSAALMRAA